MLKEKFAWRESGKKVVEVKKVEVVRFGGWTYRTMARTTAIAKRMADTSPIRSWRAESDGSAEISSAYRLNDLEYAY